MIKKITKLTAVLCLLVFANSFAQQMRYVKQVASGTGDGSSWENASGDLQEMINQLSVLTGTRQVWLAKGNYKPTTAAAYPTIDDNSSPATGTIKSAVKPRFNTFLLKTGVDIYGGFDGSDDPSQTIAGRDLVNNITMLDGNMANGSRLIHIVLALNLTSATILDGLTIANGQANIANNTNVIYGGYTFSSSIGAAMVIRNADLRLKNVEIRNNIGNSSGIALSVVASSASDISKLYMDNCVVDNNDLTYTGNSGVISVLGGANEVTIVNSRFTNNRNNGASGSNNGGALSVAGTSALKAKLHLQNNTFTNNYSGNRGGAAYIANTDISVFEDCVFEGNTTKLDVSSGDYYSGAVHIHSGVTVNKLKNLVFRNNKSGLWGGAMLIGTDAVIGSIENSVFENNEALGSEVSTAGRGGALFFNTDTHQTKVSNCKFVGNSSASGGAIYFHTSNGAGIFSIDNSLFAYNSCKSLGGALVANDAEVNILNSTFYNNTSAESNKEAIHLAAGTGKTKSSKLINSLVLANTSTLSQFAKSGAGIVDLQVGYSLISGAAPSFATSANTTYNKAITNIFQSTDASSSSDFLRLSTHVSNSAINAGTIEDVTLLDKDLDGNDRVYGLSVDLGAYELQTSTLPVKFTGLSAKKSSNSITLNWATTAEYNNSHFYIERSANGKDFSFLTTLKAIGEQGGKYSYKDERPLLGDNYYRLVQVDLDGVVNVLGVVSSAYQIAADAVNVYPNPLVNSTVTVSFSAGKFATLKLVSLNGKVLSKYVLNAQQTTQNLDVQSLQKGIYFVQLQGNAGAEVVKIIK